MASEYIAKYFRLPSKNEDGNNSKRVDSLETRSNSDHKDSRYNPYSIKQLSDRSRPKEKHESKHQISPSFMRLVNLSLPEWLYAVLGSLGASIFGSFRPVLAYVVGLIVTAYYKPDASHFDVDKWCLIIGCMAIIVLVATMLQHFYSGIMGEKMTERIRRMMFSGKIFSVFILLHVVCDLFIIIIVIVIVFSHAPE